MQDEFLFSQHARRRCSCRQRARSHKSYDAQYIRVRIRHDIDVPDDCDEKTRKVLSMGLAPEALGGGVKGGQRQFHGYLVLY